MAKWVEALAAKPGNLCSNSWDPLGERKEVIPISCPLTSTHALWHAYSHIHTQDNVYIKFLYEAGWKTRQEAQHGQLIRLRKELVSEVTLETHRGHNEEIETECGCAHLG